MIFLTEYMTGNSKRAGPRIKAKSWYAAKKKAAGHPRELFVVGTLVREQ